MTRESNREFNLDIPRSHEVEAFRVTPRTEQAIEVGSEEVRTMRYESRHKRPVETVLLPGWATKIETYDQFSDELAKSGHAVTAIELGHGVDIDEKDERFKEATLRKAAAAEAALQKLFPQESKVDLVGHSEGGLVAVAYALKHPESVRSITLLNAAGLMGKNDSLPKLAGRYVQDMVRDRWITLLRGGDTPGTLRHPIRSLREAEAIAKTSDIVDLLRVLHEEHGIDVRVLQTKSDKAFPAERAWEERLEQASKEHLAVSWYRNPKSRHNAPILDQGFASATSQILDRVDKDAQLKTRQGIEERTNEETEPLGEYVHISQEQITAGMLRDIDEEQDPEKRRAMALAMIGQEAGSGNWEDAEAALTRLELSDKEQAYRDLRDRAAEQGDGERARKYEDAQNVIIDHRKTLSRIAAIEEPNTREDAIVYEASTAILRGDLDAAERIIALGKDLSVVDILRERVARPLLHEVTTLEAKEALIGLIKNVENEDMRGELLVDYTRRYPDPEESKGNEEEKTVESRNREESEEQGNDTKNGLEEDIEERRSWAKALFDPRVGAKVAAGAGLATAAALHENRRNVAKAVLVGATGYAAWRVGKYILLGGLFLKGIGAAGRSIYEKYKGHMPGWLRTQTDRMMDYAKRSREKNKRK